MIQRKYVMGTYFDPKWQSTAKRWEDLAGIGACAIEDKVKADPWTKSVIRKLELEVAALVENTQADNFSASVEACLQLLHEKKGLQFSPAHRLRVVAEIAGVQTAIGAAVRGKAPAPDERVRPDDGQETRDVLGANALLLPSAQARAASQLDGQAGIHGVPCQPAVVEHVDPRAKARPRAGARGVREMLRQFDEQLAKLGSADARARGFVAGKETGDLALGAGEYAG